MAELAVECLDNIFEAITVSRETEAEITLTDCLYLLQLLGSYVVQQ